MLADVLNHTNKKIDSLLAKLTADFNKVRPCRGFLWYIFRFAFYCSKK